MEICEWNKAFDAKKILPNRLSTVDYTDKEIYVQTGSEQLFTINLNLFMECVQ
jgi:hypothetical protein